MFVIAIKGIKPSFGKRLKNCFMNKYWPQFFTVAPEYNSYNSKN